MDSKTTKVVKSKIKEIDKLMNLDSRHPRFKAWHVATMNILKNLPAEFNKSVNEFKRLTFEDTKYHREKKPYNPAQKGKYAQHLESAKKILTGLVGQKKDKSNLTG